MKKIYVSPGTCWASVRSTKMLNGVSGNYDSRSINNEGSETLASRRGVYFDDDEDEY